MQTRSDRTRAIAELDGLAQLLDSRWRVPGTSVRLGVDALAGLLPGVGDVATGLVSAYIVLRAMNHGVGRGLVARMIGNVLLDTVVRQRSGCGLNLRCLLQANNRNIRMLRSHLEKVEENARG